jgi:hypothetical protein
MVLVMQARQGSSETVVMVMQYLEQKKRDNSIRIDMEAFFEAMNEIKHWNRAATEKLIQRGRSLFKLANLRPEEVLCVRMYTVRVLALVHVSVGRERGEKEERERREREDEEKAKRKRALSLAGKKGSTIFAAGGRGNPGPRLTLPRRCGVGQARKRACFEPSAGLHLRCQLVLYCYRVFDRGTRRVVLTVL